MTETEWNERLAKYREMERRRNRFSNAATSALHKTHDHFGNFTNPDENFYWNAHTFLFA